MDLSQPGAWDKPELLTPLLQEKSHLTDLVDQWDTLLAAKEELEEWLEMAKDEQTQDILEALDDQIQLFQKKLEEAELNTLLAGANDSAPALLEIHPGAGGTEAQDWAEMLLRMFVRWAERHDFKVKILDQLPGDEAGIKSVTLLIDGVNAFGLLKSERGIHRLVRISPFDSSGRRHTSFASVDVYPDVTRDIEIEIRDEDVRIDVFRASGAGGQHVNKTSSAVRLTHAPTGIVVSCQNEKSQHRNKEIAFKILKARLYEREQDKIAQEKQAQYADKDAIAWGSQIRSYILQPYRMVKDHRTSTDITQVDDVLDGDLDTLIRNYLLYIHAKKQA
ncbi:peptide chain release factor 2 [Desulfobaculum bizertense DSM 18034]|uniref:Peptide chain release factor 2 n=2 Tax=Desulfobaculum TaxID=1433996 RepID=A0A1T4W3E9_9BACT|nr:peptide chain release factor 2 [Desulfobaculum bizertense DSM 18034]